MRLIRGVKCVVSSYYIEIYARGERREFPRVPSACERRATAKKNNRNGNFFLSSLPRCERLDFAASEFSKLPARYRLRRVVTHFT